MTFSKGRFRRRIFGLSDDEATFSRRGFRGESRARGQLEHIGCTFLHGYHAALEESDLHALTSRLNSVEPEFRGFAFEGAAMGLALIDILSPWRKRRFQAFLHGPGDPHAYMLYVGYGWMLARLRRPVGRALTCLDPLLGWLAVDGYGFHEGYFHWPRFVAQQARPSRLSGYALNVFDQGLGRSLWFVEGADVTRIPETIAAFSEARKADLWSGIGLACAYAGGVDCAEMLRLHKAAGTYRVHLAQGASFAAKARQRAGNLSAHTEQACRILCAMSALEAARLTDVSLEALPMQSTQPAYEVWRGRIQAQFV